MHYISINLPIYQHFKFRNYYRVMSILDKLFVHLKYTQSIQCFYANFAHFNGKASNNF